MQIPVSSMAVMIPISRKNRITFPVLNFPTCLISQISPGRNLTIRQRNQNQHGSADGDQEQNSFHQRVKFERNGMTIYFLVDPELFLSVGLTHDPFVNAVDQKY